MPGLDGVRGLGVLGVLLFHAGHLAGGWLGVDLFFVLSRFLITSLLLVEFGRTGSISLAAFWARRARRLLPALFLALLGVAAFAVFVADPAQLPRIQADALATLAYVANWHTILAGHAYWDLFRQPLPLDHTWSLAIEEQFYLVWPPLAYWVLRHSGGSRARLAIVGLGLAFASAIWMGLLFDPRDGSDRVYLGTDTRAFSTLLGSVLAAILSIHDRTRGKRATLAWNVAGSMGLVVLVWAWVGLDGQEPSLFRGGLFALAVAECAFIGGVVHAPSGLPGRLASLAPLRGLGIISYGLYLWHWPVYLALTPDRLGVDGWVLTAIRVAVSVVLAAVSYRVVERPIRRGRLTLKQSGILGVGGAGLVASAIVLATGGLSPARPRAIVPAELAPAVLLVGDSVAMAMGPEFREEGARRGVRAESKGWFACGALRSSRGRFANGVELSLDFCESARDLWQAWVAEHRPHVVVLLEGWPGAEEKEIAGRFSHPCEPDYDSAYAADLAALVHDFARRGARPAIMLSAPPSIPDAPEKVLELWPRMKPEKLSVLLNERMTCQNRVRREVIGQTGAIALDLDAWICPSGRCRREINGVLLRSDGVHFRDDGARIVAGWLFDQLRPHLTSTGPGEP